MPATVRVSESARTSLRAILIIAAAVVLLVPIAFSVAHGASRLNYGKTEMTEALPASTDDLRFDFDTGARVIVKTSDTAAPSVKLTATGPRDRAPDFTVRTTGSSTVLTLADDRKMENTQVVVTLPSAISQGLALDFNGGLGSFEARGDFQEISAKTDGGAIDISGSADRVETATDWGATSLSGTFGTVESKTEMGALDGSNLSIRDRIHAVTSTGTVELDFTNDMVPESGIVAKAEVGAVDIRLPNLELAQRNMAAEADKAEELFYSINADSLEGTVDLAADLEKYKASADSQDTEGKTIIPVSVTAETGTVTINQN